MGSHTGNKSRKMNLSCCIGFGNFQMTLHSNLCDTNNYTCHNRGHWRCRWPHSCKYHKGTQRGGGGPGFVSTWPLNNNTRRRWCELFESKFHTPVCHDSFFGWHDVNYQAAVISKMFKFKQFISLPYNAASNIVNVVFSKAIIFLFPYT